MKESSTDPGRRDQGEVVDSDHNRRRGWMRHHAQLKLKQIWDAIEAREK